MSGNDLGPWADDDEQLLRYSRQILLPSLDLAGQQRLIDGKVLIVGAGGLGTPVAMYLAGAGVGELVICDHDRVDLSNLHRQILYTSDDIGSAKVVAAAARLARMNPQVHIVPRAQRMDATELQAAVAGVDVVVDASDNFATRFAVNEACVAARRPLVSGAAIRLEGQIAVFAMDRLDSPCYRCLYSDTGADDESCARTGVLGPVVGIIGSMQALEVLKLLAGVGTSLAGRLLLFDGLRSEWQQLRVPRDPDCPVCGHRPQSDKGA